MFNGNFDYIFAHVPIVDRSEKSAPPFVNEAARNCSKEREILEKQVKTSAPKVLNHFQRKVFYLHEELKYSSVKNIWNKRGINRLSSDLN